MLLTFINVGHQSDKRCRQHDDILIVVIWKRVHSCSFHSKHTDILGMSIVFYCILTFAAYRSCDQILASFTQVHGIDQNVTREEIDRIYMKISNSIGSKTLDNRLVQHRNELHRTMFINHGLENWQIWQKICVLKTEIGKGVFKNIEIVRDRFNSCLGLVRSESKMSYFLLICY